MAVASDIPATTRRSSPTRLARSRVLGALTAVWLVVSLSGVWWIGTESLTATGPNKCEREISDQSPYGSHTVFGDATWTWMPPGRVCRYDDGVITSPSVGRGVLVALILGSVPLTVAAVALRRPRTEPEPADT